jgi:hypothetical protein
MVINFIQSTQTTFKNVDVSCVNYFFTKILFLEYFGVAVYHISESHACILNDLTMLEKCR